MEGSISVLVAIKSPNRANYALAIESLTDSGEETKRFGLDFVVGKNLVIANSMDDFPDADSGARTLAVNTTYAVADNLTTSDRFIALAGSEICGFGAGASSLTYTGSGVFFTIVDIDFEFRQFQINLSNTGTLLSASSATGNNFILLADMMVFNAAKLGTLTSTSLSMTNCNLQFFADGWSLVGTFLFFQNFLVGYLDNTSGSIAIDLGIAVVGNFIIRDSAVRGTGTGISWATDSANITAGLVGDIATTEFPISTPLSGIARDDFRWRFANCRGILDSNRIGEAALAAADTVVISTQGVHAQVGLVDSGWCHELYA